MRIFSRMTGSVAVLALIAAAASPAAARDGRWGGRHHHDRGPSAGSVIGAIAAVGILAAVASSAAKKREAEQRRYEVNPPVSGGYDERYDERYGDGDARYDGRAAPDPRYNDVRGDRADQDAAVNDCVVAARDEAGRGGSFAEITGVGGVSPRVGGWDVTGRVEQRSSYRADDGSQRNFRCSWSDGRVGGLSLD
jgi:hypothetical protein